MINLKEEKCINYYNILLKIVSCTVYYVKRPPYSKYNAFEDDEKFLITKFIKDTQEYMQQNNVNDKYINQLEEIINYFKELVKNKKQKL